jgi:long-chain acyl-CoA synthetase
MTHVGYWGRPSDADRDPSGFVTVGDFGVVDDEGFLRLVGRDADMLISGGFNVYPQEVEGVLNAHPQVHESAVFGVVDQKWGESVRAACVLRPGAATSVEELRAWCRDQLSGYKVPRHIDIRQDLPKSEGKVLRRELKRMAEAHGAASATT